MLHVNGVSGPGTTFQNSVLAVNLRIVLSCERPGVDPASPKSKAAIIIAGDGPGKRFLVPALVRCSLGLKDERTVNLIKARAIEGIMNMYSSRFREFKVVDSESELMIIPSHLLCRDEKMHAQTEELASGGLYKALKRAVMDRRYHDATGINGKWLKIEQHARECTIARWLLASSGFARCIMPDPPMANIINQGVIRDIAARIAH